MKGDNKYMNKFLQKLAKLFLGISLAAGVGVAVSAAKKEISPTFADDTYTLVTSNGELSDGDKVVIATKSGSNPSTGVTGWNGSKDAEVSTTKDDWVKFEVGGASNSGWTLYDPTAKNYIASPGGNEFKYGTAGTCSVSGTGVLNCNSRELCSNSGSYRFYSGKDYTKFYVWKVTSSGGGGGSTSGTATYTVSSKTAATTTGTTPQDSSITFNNNGSNNNDQMTSGKRELWTITGYTGKKITSFKANLRNNASSGAGSATLTNNSTSVSLKESSFSGLGSTYAEHELLNSAITVAGDLVLTLNCSTSSFYCNYIKLAWENGGFSVVYNGNGNTGGSVPIDNTGYSSGATVTVKGNTGSLVKTGYTFSGWTLNDGGTGTVYGPSYTTTISITANINFYAKWTAKTSALIFNLNGGTGTAPTGKTATYGSAMPSYGQSAPTKEGYVFGGFYDQSGGTGTQYYTAGLASAKNWDKDKTDGTTLYAKWTAKTSALIFNLNGGTGTAPTGKTATYGSAMPSYGQSAPTKEGYVFGGFYDGEGGTGNQYYTATLESARNWDKDITTGTELYAKWIEACTVTFDVQGHGVAPANQSVIEGNEVEEPTDPSATGYIFGGWYKEEACTTPWTFTGVGADTVSQDTILYAKWTAKTSALFFDLEDGTGTAPEGKIATYGQAMPSYGVSAPTRTGYTFGGFFDGEGGTGIQYYTANLDSAKNWDKNVTDGTTLYAKWTMNTYTVSSSTSGLFVSTNSISYTGGEITLTTNARKKASNVVVTGNANVTIDSNVVTLTNVLSNISISADVVDATPTLNVTGQKTAFVLGEEFSFGGTVKARYDDWVSPHTEDTIQAANYSVDSSDFDGGAEGNYTIIVSFSGAADFEYSVTVSDIPNESTLTFLEAHFSGTYILDKLGVNPIASVSFIDGQNSTAWNVSSSQIRVYKGGYLVVKPLQGYILNSITVTYTANKGNKQSTAPDAQYATGDVDDEENFTFSSSNIATSGDEVDLGDPGLGYGSEFAILSYHSASGNIGYTSISVSYSVESVSTTELRLSDSTLTIAKDGTGTFTVFYYNTTENFTVTSGDTTKVEVSAFTSAYGEEGSVQITLEGKAVTSSPVTITVSTTGADDKTLSVTVKEIEQFEKVTTIDKLVNGAELVFVKGSKISSSIQDSRYTLSSATLKNNIVYSEDTYVKFRINVSSKGYTLYDLTSEQYLSGNTSSGTIALVDNTESDYAFWNITISNGLFVISNVGDSSMRLQKNSSFDYFAPYSSNQANMEIFVKGASSITVAQSLDAFGKLYLNTEANPITTTPTGVDTGVCRTSGSYLRAKAALAGDWNVIATALDSDITGYGLRYKSWAIANNDGAPFDGNTEVVTTISGSRLLAGIINRDTDKVAIIVIISMVSVTAIGGYFLRRRKENI